MRAALLVFPGYQARLRASGAIPIDARQPLGQTVDAILSRTLASPGTRLLTIDPDREGRLTRSRGQIAQRFSPAPRLRYRPRAKLMRFSLARLRLPRAAMSAGQDAGFLLVKLGLGQHARRQQVAELLQLG
jgi:hypothetical protein